VNNQMRDGVRPGRDFPHAVGPALPGHCVTLDGFWIDRTPITARAFFRFVSATGCITVAEQEPDPTSGWYSLRHDVSRL
jgi:formylglycine-generating enzyme required for sulfatase activity